MTEINANPLSPLSACAPFVLLLLCTLAAAKAGACTLYPMYVRITVDWGDGTSSSHYEFDGWTEVGCGGGGSSGGGGSQLPPGGGLGGGATTTRNQYVSLGCEAPDIELFENASAYDGHPAANFTFGELSGGNNGAILTEELKFGLDQMVNALDGRVPVITDAYRTPNQNTGLVGSAKCSAHTYGRAADISIRDPNNNDAFSCTLWNMYVEATDNWVEPWADTIANGGTPHFHIDSRDPGMIPVPAPDIHEGPMASRSHIHFGEMTRA